MHFKSKTYRNQSIRLIMLKRQQQRVTNAKYFVGILLTCNILKVNFQTCTQLFPFLRNTLKLISVMYSPEKESDPSLLILRQIIV